MGGVVKRQINRSMGWWNKHMDGNQNSIISLSHRGSSRDSLKPVPHFKPLFCVFCVYTAATPALWPANWMNVGPTNCSASTKNQEPYQSKAGDQHKRDVTTWFFSGAGRWKSKLDLNLFPSWTNCEPNQPGSELELISQWKRGIRGMWWDVLSLTVMNTEASRSPTEKIRPLLLILICKKIMCETLILLLLERTQKKSGRKFDPLVHFIMVKIKSITTINWSSDSSEFCLFLQDYDFKNIIFDQNSIHFSLLALKSW